MQKDYSKNKSHGIQNAETFFFFLKGKKGRGIYVLCFKSNKNAKNRTGNACFVAI